MIVLSIIVLIFYFGLYGYCFKAVLKGNFYYVLLYSVLFFPVYTVFLALVFNGLESPILNSILQYSKELLIFSAVGIILFGGKEVLKKTWKLSLLDAFFIGFIGISFIYLLLPIGEASFLNKAIYFKNILLIGVFYYLGRYVTISNSQWTKLFRIIFGLTFIACLIVVFEKLTGTHFHSLIGYAKYNDVIKEIDPVGIFGLTWTFEAQGGQARFGSFFSNPLEFSASMLIGVAGGIIYLLSVRHKPNQVKYLLVIFCAFVCVSLAYSRATFVAFFLMIVFIAFLLRYYKLLSFAFLVLLMVTAYIMFFAADDVKYFVEDTLSFENSSSLTHLVEWAEGIESMISNPQGIGLATSGNAGGVEKDLQVGGENQYLIYGVQLGFMGLAFYLGMLLIGIRNSWKAFRMSQNRNEAVIPFVAASVKFGMLLPLFTANGEAYLYVSLVSWWLIGYSESLLQNLKKAAKYPLIKRQSRQTL